MTSADGCPGGRATEAALRIWRDVRRQEGRTVGLLRDLVETGSYATQTQGVESVARRMVGELESAGFRCARPALVDPPVEEAWLADLLLPGVCYSSLPAAVVGRRPGLGHQALVLGDMDTDYGPGGIAPFPFAVSEYGVASGRGVADMKGGLTVLAGAMRALAAIALAAPPVVVVLAPDEQAGSLWSRSIISDKVAQASSCLCVESARDAGQLLASRSQVGVARVVVYGREVHIGSAHGSGVDAPAPVAELIGSLRELTDVQRGVCRTVTIVQGGRWRTVVAGEASCIVDVRTADGDSWREVEPELCTRIASAARSAWSVKVDFVAHRPAVTCSEATHRPLDVAKTAGYSLGVNVSTTRSGLVGVLPSLAPRAYLPWMGWAPQEARS